MTGFVIDATDSVDTSTANADAEHLTGVDDTLLVTSAGSLISLAGGDGIDSIGDTEQITLDGFAYGEADVGVQIQGDDTSLLVDGEAQGQDGVTMSGSGDTVDVGVQGVVNGSGLTGIEIVDSKSGDTINNSGYVTGSSDGIYCTLSGDDNILNVGVIQSNDGIFLNEAKNDDRVDNSGRIIGGSVGILSSTSSISGNHITNSGVIDDDIGIELDSESDADTGADAISNSGLISSSSFAIEVLHEVATVGGSSSSNPLVKISNTGVIQGGMYADSNSPVEIDNSGTWQATAAEGGFRLTCFDGYGGDLLINSGTIDANMAIEASSAEGLVLNSGTITGAVTFTRLEDGVVGIMENTGNVTGAISFNAIAANSLTNSGEITGDISMCAYYNKIYTNNHAHPGYVLDTISNTGEITGTIAVKGLYATLTNAGRIYGDVDLSSGSTLVNSGEIRGDLSLTSNDTVSNRNGEITGIITGGSSNDDFVFRGSFGHEEIVNFLDGAASGHDKLEFGADDFGSFSAVKSAMKQVGNDVLIKLGGSDTILLDGITLSKLVLADFKFV